jgi:lactate permease
MWQQNYEPVGGSLAWSALVASIPIAVLFFMLGVWRKPSWMAALTPLGAAFVLALGAYGMPAPLALMAALTGAPTVCFRSVGKPHSNAMQGTRSSLCGFREF